MKNTRKGLKGSVLIAQAAIQQDRVQGSNGNCNCEQLFAAKVRDCNLFSSLVVMNRLAIYFMKEIYGIPSSKISLIPHGVRETEYKEPPHYKKKLAYDDRFLILTFGFLSPNKGVETVIKSLACCGKKESPLTLYSFGNNPSGRKEI